MCFSEGMSNAHEIISNLCLKLVRKVGFMVLKLDMSKAFDRVE